MSLIFLFERPLYKTKISSSYKLGSKAMENIAL